MADPFVSPFEKPALLLKLAQRGREVTQTLADVVQGKEKPEEILGSRAFQQLRGARAVSRQLTQDILPDAVPQLQRLLQDATSNPQQPVTDLGSSVSSDFVKVLDDLTADGKPPTLPRFEDIASELRQIFETTPSDLETPAYSVLEQTPDFEIREYREMTLAMVDMKPRQADGNVATGGQGNAFQTLAAFLFGENSEGEPMAMTTPVITSADRSGESTTMAFVIPSKYSAESAPQPFNGSKIQVQDVPAQKVASREFPGFATDQEVVRQREQLTSALRAAGWTFQEDDENRMQVEVLQYNPPYTLPTLRRNEVLVKLTDSWVSSTGTQVADADMSVAGGDMTGDNTAPEIESPGDALGSGANDSEVTGPFPV